MNKFEKHLKKEILTDDEILAIETKADLKRQEKDLNLAVLELEKEHGGDFDSNVIESILKESSGQLDDSFDGPKERLIKEAEELIKKAEKNQNNLPNLSAFLFAQAAKLNQVAGKDFQEALNNSKETIKKAKDIPKMSPQSLFPNAVIIGIEKRLAENLALPPMEKIFQTCSKNRELLKQYALILPEDQRDSFVNMFPENQRKEISAIIDYEISPLLKQDIVIGPKEKKQRESVKQRSGKVIKEGLEAPKNVDKKIIKHLIRVIKQLDGEDSKKLLLGLGKRGLKGDKDFKKDKERNSRVARILNELMEIDIIKGSDLAMKFLAKKEVNNHLFVFFSKKLIREKHFTKNIKEYLDNIDGINFLRKLIAEYPNQFNTVIDTVSKIEGYSPLGNQEEVFSAIEDLGSLTPIIFNRYRLAGSQGKKELAHKIKELKPKFFQNQPIRDVLSIEDRDILTEMVYLAYKPVGMSFNNVKSFIDKIDDCTEHLKEYNFPEQGYDFELKGGKSFVLKPGKSLERSKLRTYRELFSSNIPSKEEELNDFSNLLSRLAKGGTDFNSKDMSNFLSLISGDQMVRNFLNRYKNLNETNHYQYLNELKEILGIYFKDNFHQRLSNFFSANPKTEGRILKILSNPNRIEIIKRKLAQEAKDLDWDKATAREGTAEILSSFFQSKALKGLREEISRNINKFIGTEEAKIGIKEEQAVGRNLKAYISKNIGSFFAKASAGICTADDIKLFERPDHFHINIVENDEFVRGNIQAYIIKENNEKSLVLRGFNPNTSFLKKVDAGSFCEASISVARKFKEGNGFSKLYITEHLSGWHALSNRPPVAQYLNKKYVKEKTKKEFQLKIASSQDINYIYEI